MRNGPILFRQFKLNTLRAVFGAPGASIGPTRGIDPRDRVDGPPILHLFYKLHVISSENSLVS